MDKDKKPNTEQQIEIIAQAVVRIEAGVETLREGMNERFDKVEASLNKRYQEIDVLRDRMRLLETRVDNLEAVRR